MTFVHAHQAIYYRTHIINDKQYCEYFIFSWFVPLLGWRRAPLVKVIADEDGDRRRSSRPGNR